MLADHAEITREHLSELERGKKEIGIKTLDKVLSALEVNLESFFKGIDVNPKP